MTRSASRVVTIVTPGGPDVLRIESRPLPQPASGQIRIAVRAAGVAFGDLLLREGLVLGGRGEQTPGYDVVGIVDAVGPDADEALLGTRRAAWVGTGGYAEHVLVVPELTVEVPEKLRDDVAAAVVLNFTTAWQLVVRAGAVGEGATVIVHGAAGAVGRALSAIASLRGIRVIAIDAASRLDSLPSTAYRLDRKADWPTAMRRIAPGGVDAVFDGVGGRTGARSFALLGNGGILVSFGATAALRGGRRSLRGLLATAIGSARTSALASLRRGTGMRGYLSAEFVPRHPAWFREDLGDVLSLIASGDLEAPPIHRFALDDAAQAQRSLAAGLAGKAVLIV